MTPKSRTLESLTKEIEDLVMIFRKNCQKLRMEEKAIDKLMEGAEIIICPYCKTYNMYESFHNEKDNWSMYECAKCDKSYFKRGRKI